MSQRLTFVNLVLLAAIALVGWQVYGNWRQAEQSRQELLDRTAGQIMLEPLPVPAPPQPVLASDHAAAAQYMLFAADRNPGVVVEVAAPPQMPALPSARGVVNLGAGPVAILRADRAQPFKGFAPGEMVSDFKLVSVSQEEIVLSWNGQTIRKQLSELLENEIAQATPGARTDAPAAPAAKQVRQEPKGPGTAMGGAAHAC